MRVYWHVDRKEGFTRQGAAFFDFFCCRHPQSLVVCCVLCVVCCGLCVVGCGLCVVRAKLQVTMRKPEEGGIGYVLALCWPAVGIGEGEKVLHAHSSPTLTPTRVVRVLQQWLLLCLHHDLCRPAL